MRRIEIIGALLIMGLGAAANPCLAASGAGSADETPLAMPAELGTPAGDRADAPPLLDEDQSAAANFSPFHSAAHRSSYHLQSDGISDFDVTNLKIFGATIGGNGVYRGAVATLNWDY